MARELTKPYYECHVTLKGDKAVLEPLVVSRGWVFSAIDGDIILGEGVKCYSTKHYNADKYSQQDVIDLVRAHAQYLMRCNVEVIREKVEKVVYDNRL